MTGLCWLVGCSSNRGFDAGGPSVSDAGSGGEDDVSTGGVSTSASGGAPASGGATGSSGQSGSAPVGDACDAEAEGRARCSSGGDLEICRQGAYVADERCGAFERCNAARGSCLECAPGEFRCTEERLEQCNLEGSAYEVVRSCASAADCVADAHFGYCRVCEAGTIVCEDSVREFDSSVELATHTLPGSSLRACNDDGSGTAERDHCDPAAPVCDVTAGRCLVCEPGKTTCAGSRLVRCDATGSAIESEMECGHPALCDAMAGVCLPRECEGSDTVGMQPGAVECRGGDQSELQVCGPSGQWELLANCSTRESCDPVARRCHDDSVCIPGSTLCEGDVIYRCAEASPDDGGRPRAGSAYYPDQRCAGACLVTEAGAVCEVVERTLCGPGETNDQCGQEQVCDGTLAEGCTVCLPGSFYCVNGVLSTCQYSEASARYEIGGIATCGSGVCDADRGACLDAQPGEYACVGTSYVRIESDGTRSEIANCGAEKLCDPIAGCRVSACIVGSTSCGGVNGNEVLECVDGLVPTSPPREICRSAERCEPGLGCARVARVTAGDSHTCALFVHDGKEQDESGYLKCWGSNDSGQLGNGATLTGDEPEARPVVVSSSPNVVAAASPHFLASGLCAGRRFSCADYGAPGETAGVACWGSNAKGQLGSGLLGGNASSALLSRYVSRLVTDGTDVAPTDGVGDTLANLSGVTCGAEFACALDAEGRAFCWGANDAGQLGRGEVSDLASPLARMVAGEHQFTQIVAGARHACALELDGGVYCWGEGTKGQLGAAPAATSASPARVGELEGVALGAGRDFTIVTVTGEPEALAWGQNLFGQLSTGMAAASDTPVAAIGLPAEEVSGLFSGPSAAHACAVRGGTLLCWGANALGQLGDGSSVDRDTPVEAIDGAAVEFDGRPGSVALGKAHTCAIDVMGNLWCWGNNRRFQLGSSAERPTAFEPFLVY